MYSGKASLPESGTMSPCSDTVSVVSLLQPVNPTIYPPRPPMPPRVQMFACRTNAIGASHNGRLLGLLLRAVLVDRAVGDGEGAVRDRDARVQADLEQHLADLVGGHAVAQGGLGVHGQLALVLQGGEHGQRDDGALRPAQAGAGPDLAPGVPGDPVLERGAELARVGHGPVHVGVAEDRPPDRHALLGALFVIHWLPRSARRFLLLSGLILASMVGGQGGGDEGVGRAQVAARVQDLLDLRRRYPGPGQLVG